ncbi:Hsp20/alpha crystallin family protein [Thermodesulfobacteriota bacterium]
MADQEIQPSPKTEAALVKGELTRQGVYFTPAVDIFETEKELVILADMPGVDPSNLDVDLNDDTLSVVGKVGDSERGDNALLSEYRVGNYFRSFTLGDVVDPAKISATLKDGVLRVVLQKADKAVARRIPITAG